MIDDNFKLKKFFNLSDEEYELNVSLCNEEIRKIRKRQQESMFMTINEFEFYLANEIHIPFYVVVYI